MKISIDLRRDNYPSLSSPGRCRETGEDNVHETGTETEATWERWQKGVARERGWGSKTRLETLSNFGEKIRHLNDTEQQAKRKRRVTRRSTGSERSLLGRYTKE